MLGVIMQRRLSSAGVCFGLLVACVLVTALPLQAQSTHAAPADVAAEGAHAQVGATQNEAAGHSELAIGPAKAAEGHAGGEAVHHVAPTLLSTLPFVILLLCIAILPLIPSVAHHWHHNSTKLVVALILACVTGAYYLLRGTGFGHGEEMAAAGMPSLLKVLHEAVLADYIPFMMLLFSLYTICGGIQLRGDLKATPLTNCGFLLTGALLASIVGTTGASMLLIRPLLQTNKERHHVKHTVIFFIFLVSNIGGCLLPIGDPPLFLGYLKGVPFLWTLHLWKEWGFCVIVLLVIYFIWDTRAYATETPAELRLDATQIEPLRVKGTLNFVWLLGVVFAVALIVPGKPFPGIGFIVPPFLREAVMLMLVGLAWVTSSSQVRKENEFDFGAIIEVAVLFIGIFITMQAPVEILKIKGPELPLTTPARFFWATGSLSSFLDNAPTYVVFFSTANALTTHGGPGILQLVTQEFIRFDLLAAISLGAVFMGANTYIGNGPNFMVKSIAESSGVKMPSFFGYMLYSIGILIPLFVVVMLLFLL